MVTQVTIYGDAQDDLTPEELGSLSNSELLTTENFSVESNSTDVTGGGTVLDDGNGLTTVEIVSDDGELATVEASSAGDIVNGVQTSSNAIGTTATNSDYAAANKGLPATSIGRPQFEMPNPLHQYATYTYNLSFHMLTPKQYTDMTMGSPITGGGHCLIASAGKWDAVPSGYWSRNAAFAEDFYFDDLKINSVVGISPRSRSSNVIDVNFTIIEPNGFTFINRLLEAATRIDAKNYMELPYMLQIEFHGSDDTGRPWSPIQQPKFIPIHLTGIKTKVTAKGAEYRVTGAAYNHKAFNETIATAPANFQVKATTVQDFFGAGVANTADSPEFVANKQRADQLKEQILGATDPSQRALLQKQYDTITNANQVYTLKDGYTNALNQWFYYLYGKNKRTTVDQVQIVLDPAIANALVVIPDKNSTTRAGNSTGNEKDAARAATGATVGGPKFTEGYYPINAGTSIEAVIESVIRNSTYVLDQVNDPTTTNPKTPKESLSTPLKWFKIVPQIILGPYDYVIGQYSKKIIYYVKPYYAANKHPGGPLGKVPGFVKKYSYIYTGHNNDVIDLSLDFDMLAYTQITANKTENQATVDIKRNDLNVVDKNVPEVPVTNAINTKRFHYVSQDVQYSGQFYGTRDPRTLVAGDLQRDLLGSARGDMINIKLTIIGDPTWLKQDDVFYGQTAGRIGTQSASGSYITPNGSLVMDESELYVLVMFKTPTDYDESTGLMKNDRYAYSMFSGIYKTISVESVFSKGKFTQVLNLIRLYNQPQFDDLLGGQYYSAIQYQRIESVKDLVLAPIQGAIGGAFGSVAQALNVVGTVVGAAQQIVQNAQNMAMGAVYTVINGITDKVMGTVNRAIDAVVSPYVEAISNWWEGLKSDIGGWFDEAFEKATDWASETFDSVVEATSEFFSEAFDSAYTAVSGWFDSATDQLGDLASQAFESFDASDFSWDP